MQTSTLMAQLHLYWGGQDGCKLCKAFLTMYEQQGQCPHIWALAGSQKVYLLHSSYPHTELFPGHLGNQTARTGQVPQSCTPQRAMAWHQPPSSVPAEVDAWPRARRDVPWSSRCPTRHTGLPPGAHGGIGQRPRRTPALRPSGLADARWLGPGMACSSSRGFAPASVPLRQGSDASSSLTRGEGQKQFRYSHAVAPMLAGGCREAQQGSAGAPREAGRCWGT